MENYKVIKGLGQGTFGVVHMAEQKGTGRVVAIKKIKSERPDEGINFTAVREIKLLREFKHENIIELVDCFTTPDLAVCLVYEVRQIPRGCLLFAVGWSSDHGAMRYCHIQTHPLFFAPNSAPLLISKRYWATRPFPSR